MLCFTLCRDCVDPEANIDIEIRNEQHLGGEHQTHFVGVSLCFRIQVWKWTFLVKLS